jgi:hypothetical protein
VSELGSRAVVSAEVSHVIVRGCTRCQHPRTIGESCAGCGNPEPPLVCDLGVTSAEYRNPLRRFWWRAAGRHLANRRIARANAQAATLR